MENGLRTQARPVLRKPGGACESPSIRISEQTDALVMRLMLPSASREQALVGDHRSVMGRSVWTLLLAVLFMQSQGSPRDLQLLRREATTLIVSAVRGCHVGALCQLMEGHERRYVPQQKPRRGMYGARGYVGAVRVDLPIGCVCHGASRLQVWGAVV